MSYKNGRSENLFSKTNRVDRYKQMTKQQQLIEEKKRQIQEKQEQLKRKEAEEALKKIQSNEVNSDKKKPLVFSNDGTFLDQFRKLSGLQAQDAGNKDKEKPSPPEIMKQIEIYERDSVKNSSTEVEEIELKGEDETSSNDLEEDTKNVSQFPPPLPPPDSLTHTPSLQQQATLQPHPQMLSQPQTVLQSHPPLPQFQQQPPQNYHIPYSVPPPPPPVMPPPMMPQNIPPPIAPQSIPPPRPMNVQNIPPPPLNIPPPPLPPRYPPPPQFPVSQLPPHIPNLCLPPPIFNSNQEKIQGNTQSEGYTPPLEIKQEPDSKDWFSAVKENPPDEVSDTVPIKEEPIAEIKQEPSENDQKPLKSGERKRKSRWSDEKDMNISTAMNLTSIAPKINVTGMSGHMISKVTRTDPGLLQYALTAYGSTNLSDEDWKKAEENYKVHLLYQDMMAKRAEVEKLKEAGKNKYEYDSDEEIDEKGTWEHKLREKEMIATQEWAESLTEMAKGKHHIGDFLPPDELKKFMAKYQAAKGGDEPDLSDYKEYKLGEENKGFQMLQKLGWSEGQGLGSDGAGRLDPINKGKVRDSNEGLGHQRPDDVSTGDDEYDAYRKRMMLAYRFRPNPLNNPRRPYY
ncbi:SURP and G-patch domain-containing protein 1 isoform X2 [Halyomorpha halys]|uniref:SURP and G-patch domain-containing protein 1 isoform X2 n=1 Tax=Halyomorpha halys TaxID=286706 RepID=UPI0006D4F4A0|nr:actin cytoskeleton-regulatory complex protein pan1-like isoform X2 [Halyomorpha halys]